MDNSKTEAPLFTDVDFVKLEDVFASARKAEYASEKKLYAIMQYKAHLFGAIKKAIEMESKQLKDK